MVEAAHHLRVLVFSSEKEKLSTEVPSAASSGVNSWSECNLKSFNSGVV